MSYILDALKKAEGQRVKSPVPTLTTVHPQGAVRPRRRRWAFAVGGLLALNGAALFLLARPVSPPPSAPATSAPAARAGNQEGAGRTPPVVAEPPRPEPLRAAPPAVVPVSPPPPRAPIRSAAAPQKPAPAGPETPSGLPASVSKLPPPAAGSGTPLLSELPAAFQQRLPRMRVEVHVYSESPGERLVFINGAKYLEGQSIEGRVLVERITPDGIVLSSEGQRFLLRR